MVWRIIITGKINNMFNYNTIIFIMQEKNCNLTLKNLRSEDMKVAVNIRMPEDMKKALDEIAASEFRSLNSVILQFLDERLKSKGVKWQKEAKKQGKAKE
jgi:hypothetical protein